jgi:hypothetical protein
MSYSNLLSNVGEALIEGPIFMRDWNQLGAPEVCDENGDTVDEGESIEIEYNENGRTRRLACIVHEKQHNEDGNLQRVRVRYVDNNGNTTFQDVVPQGVARVNPQDKQAVIRQSGPWFHWIHPDKGGGFGGIGNLFSWDRLMNLAILLIFMCMNAYGICANFHKQMTTARNAEATPHGFTFTGAILDTLGFGQLSIIAISELALLVYFWSRFLRPVILSVRYQSREAIHYGHISRSFKRIEILRAVSALNALHYIVPTVITNDLKLLKQQGATRSKYIWFFFGRIFLLVLGHDALMIKMQHVGQANQPGAPVLTAIMTNLMFLNQVLGIVKLSFLLRSRLRNFVFAGQNARMNDDKKIKLELWHAKVAEHVFKHKCSRCCVIPSIVWSLAVMCTFSAEDMQNLILNDPEPDIENLINGLHED